jgi:hypothetical protein
MSRRCGFFAATLDRPDLSRSRLAFVAPVVQAVGARRTVASTFAA